MLLQPDLSRIRRAALQTEKLFEISRRGVSMMSTLAVTTGLRHTCVTEGPIYWSAPLLRWRTRFPGEN
jgi:hypothetical protein